MTGNLTAGAMGAELAASLPQFDPLLPRSDPKTARRLILLSLALHVLVFFLFRDALMGMVMQHEETVIVRMLEQEVLKPEPPKLRRKVLAQRRIDASVTHFKDVAQMEIQRAKPVLVLDQARKVDVDPIELTEAPKRIETREVVTESVSVFAEVQTQVQPVLVDRINPEVRRVKVGQASAGPRKLDAAGPVVSARAVDIESPIVAEGVLSRNAVSGAAQGTRVASLESGFSDRLLDGTGERGLLSGVEKDCAKDPVCLKYLQMIRDRVYGRWHIPPDIDAGGVILSFRIDRGGSAHAIQLRSADEASLGNTCLAAFRHASPFPPPPKEILYIVNKKIRANFDYGN